MLTAEEFSFVAGCCFGDGHLATQNKGSVNPVLNIAHCQKQEGYLRWKASRLNQILSRNCNVTPFTAKVKSKEYPSFKYGVSSPDLWEVHSLLYKDLKKVAEKSFLDRLGLDALALLWMDDGGLCTRTHVTKTNRCLAKGCPGTLGVTRKMFHEARLSLYRGKEEAERVNEWISSLTGSSGKLYEPKKNGQFILLWRKDEFLKFIQAVKPHIHPSMYYKISIDGVGFDLTPVTIEGQSAAKLVRDD